MDIPNYVKETLNQDKEFILEMTKSSEQLFESIKNNFFKGKNREVKVLRNEANTCLYVLDKFEKNLNIYWSKIEYFQQAQSINELLNYTTNRLEQYEKVKKPDDEGRLYLLEIHGSRQSKYLEQIENGSFKEDSKENKLEENIKKLHRMGLEKTVLDKYIALLTEDSKNPDLIKEEQYQFKCSSHVDILREYRNVLNEKGFLSNKASDSFYKNLNKQGYEKRDKNLADIWTTTNTLIDICKNHKLLSESKQYVYNDLDNAIFMHESHLIMSDQSCGYYFDIKDKNNYKIYFLEKEYKSVKDEIKKIETAIKENTIDELKDVVLEVENGKTVYQHDVFMYVLDLCLTYGLEAIQELEKEIKPTKLKK